MGPAQPEHLADPQSVIVLFCCQRCILRSFHFDVCYGAGVWWNKKPIGVKKIVDDEWPSRMMCGNQTRAAVHSVNDV